MPLNFKSSVQENLYEYRHLSIEKDVVKKSWDGYMKFVESDEWDRLHEQFGVSPYCCEEAVIYLSFIWKLLESKRVFIVPIFDIHEATKRLDKDYNFIKWQYKCTAEDNKFEDSGYIPARSSYIISPIRNEFQYRYRDYGTIFEINSLEELTTLHNILIISNAYSEMNIYGLSREISIEDIRGQLSTIDKPSLDNILEDDDFFLDLILGVDIGYHDGMLLVSKRNQDTQIKQLISRINKIIEQYELRTNEIKDLNEFKNELVKLSDF
ncbi:hypothetical protein RE628_20375 [Paenibacillus sp. D2_2]|uniref:hypothetical protein n=1 Tax=Paenibacillus sp. D2_2 TaxID=3073092 RepID=UPI002815B245|nr:hypothetical protein [Paenibacillus sp. D2_2]WMT39728.1 hypothetical protein RE628_20375 [Paenibacillus sp. D2_2]